MSSAAHNPHLRLVGTDDPIAHANWVRNRRARQEVTRANRAAAQNPTLEPTDPRWVLAVRAYSQLQGSALTPERRERVMRTARHLGVRPFDANVIVAIVQDQARRGEGLSGAAPTLELIKRPERVRSAGSAWMRWVAAIATAIAANALLIMWLLRG